MSQTVVLKVGMSCQGCVGAVQRVLAKMEGVDSFEINKDEQKVTVIGNVKPEDVFQTVSKTGKKTSFWETEPKPEHAITNTEAEPEPKPKPESEPAPVAELTKTTEPEPEAVTVVTTDATPPPSTAA